MDPGSEQIRIRGSSTRYCKLYIRGCNARVSYKSVHRDSIVTSLAALIGAPLVPSLVTSLAALLGAPLVASLATSLANLQRYRQHKTHLVRSPEAGATIWGLFCYITASDVIIFKFQGFNCTPLHLSAGAHVDARFV